MFEYEYIVWFYDVGIDGRGCLFLVMEFVDGVFIDVYCCVNVLSICECVVLLQQVMVVVVYVYV